jgi:flagellar biosynthesis protein FlhA
MLDKVREKAPQLMRELLPDRMDHSTIHQVLQHLLRERVAIRDMVGICEALCDASSLTGDPLALAEAARKRLTRRINEDLANADRRIVGLTLAPDTERHVAEELQLLEDDQGLPAREALRRRAALESLLLDALACVHGAAVPVLLVSPALRPRLAAFLSRYTPRLRVLATDELHPAFRFVDVSLD